MISSNSIETQSGAASPDFGNPTGESEIYGHTPHRLPEKPLIVNTAEGGAVLLTLREFWNYHELLTFLTWRDIKVRYKQTAMGAAWAILQPLLIVLVFAVFFGLFVGVPTDGLPYLIFYYCGILPWMFFANGVSVSSMSLIGNAGLINKVYFPRIFIPTAAIAASLIDLLIALMILLGIMLYYGFNPAWHLLLLPCYLLLTVVMTFGLGVLIASLTVKYRDLRHALPFVLQLWMFLTPIIYPLNAVPQKWRYLLFINPLTGVVEGMRLAMLGRHLGSLPLAVTVLTVLGVLGCGLFAFRQVERSMADVI
jgi:lipopolysaccharide transport system permease protein